MSRPLTAPRAQASSGSTLISVGASSFVPIGPVDNVLAMAFGALPSEVPVLGPPALGLLAVGLFAVGLARSKRATA